MSSEGCRVCGAEVPFSATVHLLIHTRGEAGVVDYYVCRPCYEAELEPLFESGDSGDAPVD